MRYSKEIIIELPRDRVIDLFDNPENLSKWQPGLQSFEHLEGESGQTGAKSRLFYEMDGRNVEMIETIIKRDLPSEFSATYEAKGVMNWVYNYFSEEGSDKTRWVMDTEFKFSGMMRIMGLIMRSSFPKETLKGMNLFKEFAESSG